MELEIRGYIAATIIRMIFYKALRGIFKDIFLQIIKIKRQQNKY